MTSLNENSLISPAGRTDGFLAALSSFSIVVPVPREVRAFFMEHEDLGEVVRDVCQRCRDQFNPETQLSLEVSKDQEIDHQTLILYVRQDPYQPDLSEKIEVMDEFYADALLDKNGYFLVMTDFQPPWSR
jgi:hypothetical protein